MLRVRNHWLWLVSLLFCFHFLYAQEHNTLGLPEKSKDRWPRYKATSLVKVVGGNLPKSVKHDAFQVRYEGRIIDVQGQMRLFALEFKPDKQEYNRWLASVFIDGVDEVEVRLQDLKLEGLQQDHNQLWLDFNNYGQLARLMDMSGMVKDNDEAVTYVRYVIDDMEGEFIVHFGIFSTVGNFLTQFKGRAMATLINDGYKK